jgi:hypothetical protein
MLLPDDLEQESEELTREHWRYENARKIGRYAVTYDGEWKGGPAIWIKAAEFFEDRSREFVIVVQPIKKRWLGRTAPIGAPQQVRSP